LGFNFWSLKFFLSSPNNLKGSNIIFFLSIVVRGGACHLKS